MEPAVKDRFVAAGFLTDVAERLRGAATAVREALDRRATELSRRSAATASVNAELARGRAVLALVDAKVATRSTSHRIPDRSKWRLTGNCPVSQLAFLHQGHVSKASRTSE